VDGIAADGGGGGGDGRGGGEGVWVRGEDKKEGRTKARRVALVSYDTGLSQIGYDT
jgi:hypothetical protein